MINRHTYLLLGLMVAGGAPYLTRSHESTDLAGDAPAPATSDLPPSSSAVANQFDSLPPFSPAPHGSSDTSQYVRTAAAESQPNTQTGTANPFGGATTTRPSTTPGTTNIATTSPPNRMILASGSENANVNRNEQSTNVAGDKKQAPTDDGRIYPGPSPKNKRIEFAEIFRLDINSAWLMAHWPRVTTGLTELDWHGYRVSLTTGTQEDDVAGALTFYYDKEQVIQKMTFRGLTGDPRKLVWFVTTTYEFQREIVQDPAVQLYRLGKGRKPSELIIRPASVIRADAPHERFEIDFVMYR